MSSPVELNEPNSKRRSLFLGAGALAALGIASCSEQTAERAPAVSSDTLARIRDTKKLRAAYILYPPFVAKDPNTNQLSGLFIELMSEIASFAQIGVEYVEAKWGTMVAGLTSRQFDLVVSAVFPTIPRALIVDFAAPLMYVGLSAAVPAVNSKITTVSDLQKRGITIAVLNGEVGHEYGKRYLPQAKLITIDSADISRAIDEVVAGRADAALAESVTCILFAEQNNSVKAIFTKPALQTFGATMMLRQGDGALKSFLNNSFEFLQASGGLAELDTKYRQGRDLWALRAVP